MNKEDEVKNEQVIQESPNIQVKKSSKEEIKEDIKNSVKEEKVENIPKIGDEQ